MFDDFEAEHRFHAAWESVEIARPIEPTLFTFGATDLEYFLVTEPVKPGGTVTIRRGQVTITRPTIITPGDADPELMGFFDADEDEQDEAMTRFLLTRTAAFSNLRLSNQTGAERIVSDSVEEAVSKLNRQLDEEEEDRVAILTAPANHAGLAVMKLALERVAESTPGNLQEMRERGFLPFD